MVRTAPRALAFAAGLSLAVIAGSAPALAQQTVDPDTVVATVNGHEITMGDVQRIRARDPQLGQVPMAMLYESLLGHLIEGHLIVEKAKAEGYGDNPDVLERLNAVRDEIIRSVYLTKTVEEIATEEEIQARYDAFLKAHSEEEEVRASHILVDTEEEARALIEKLQGGADFAELAKAESTGPSAPKGGDLGYFKRDGQMVEPFAKAAFDLEAGAFTTEPVQTQFGWHVIKVTDRRMAEPPTLDDLRDQLTTELAKETIEGMIVELRKDAEIDKKPLSEVMPAPETTE